MEVARIHYEIDNDLHRSAKAAAARQGITLREFVTRAIAEAVAIHERAEKAPRKK